MTNKDKIDVLLENYKVIDDETKIYLNEILRCFVYSAIILAIGLGYKGLIDEKIELKAYIPWALIALFIYFLSIGFMYVNTSRYKAQIEYKINKLANDNLLEYESIFKPAILKYGFLPIELRKKTYRILPLPNFFLGIIALIALAVVFNVYNFKGHNNLKMAVEIGIPIVGIFIIYVFLIIPRIIEKYQMKNNWIK